MATLEEITARLNIEDVFTSRGLTITRRRGSRWECACPFCRDPKHFSLNPQKGLWKCHKCGESGNLITFVAKIENVSTGEAFKRLAEQAGLWAEAQQKKTNSQAAPAQRPNPAQQGTTRNPSGNQTTRKIYQRFVELSALTDIHRQQLKDRRGFAPNTIDTFMLRSGGPQVESTISKLREEFALEDLYESGLMVEANGHATINSLLLDDRLIIPYLDEEGTAYYLRPHKLGFSGIPVEVFSRFLLRERPEHVVITEGEFKAIALWQWRIPALAVPGVSSFGAKNLDRLVDLLREYGIKSATVIFDNEIKDNPAFPNFKEKVEDRYDTQFWSYMLAYKLGHQGIPARVGWLPDAWREAAGGAKIDFDGALAQGRTREEILAVISQAVPPKEYLAGLPEEAQRIVKRKIARHFARTAIRREFNKYVVTRFRGQESYEETISNFVINIKSSFYTPDGVIRNVELVNEYGEVSETFPLDPGDMAGLNEFKKFCFSKGNYVFEGTTQDLLNIWKLEFLRDTGELVYLPERIGRLDNNLWLFGNLAIKDGKVYRPDNDGVFWINGVGYKPQSLEIGPKGEPTQDALPCLSERKVNIQEIALRMKHCVGGYEAYLGIGWALATIFSEDIFKRYKCFPFIFPYGKRGSGKTSLMRWLMAFFGIDTEGYSIAESSQVHIVRTLSYFSSLGIWFDEYRNEPKITQKDGYLRSAYNRQISGKGIKQGFGTRGYHVAGTLAISGEDLPKDNGLFTRCIPLQISAYKRDRTWYDWLNANCQSFSGFTRELLLNYDQHKDNVLEGIGELRQALIARGISDRTAENWAIVAGTFDALVLQDDDFIRWVEQSCQQLRIAGEEEHALNQFWDDVNVLLSQGELDERHLQVRQVDEKTVLYLWFNGIFSIWAVYFRKKTGREPFDKTTMLKYLQDEPYYLGYGTDKGGKNNGDNRINFKGDRRKAHAVNVNEATETIQEIADVVAARNQINGQIAAPFAE